mgnify:FL=1
MWTTCERKLAIDNYSQTYPQYPHVLSTVINRRHKTTKIT